MPELTVTMGNQRVWQGFFGKEGIHIGRAPDNDVIIPHLSVARRHARIDFQAGHFRVSTTSCFARLKINGIVCRSGTLQDGDTLSFGRHRVVFHLQEPSDSARGETELARAGSTAAKRALILAANGNTMLSGLRRFPRVSLGRSAWARISIPDWFLRDFELVLLKDGDSFRARSIGLGHFWHNRTQCSEAELRDGDEIKVGTHTFKISFMAADLSEAEFARQESEQMVEMDDKPLQGIAGEFSQGAWIDPPSASLSAIEALDCEKIIDPFKIGQGLPDPHGETAQDNLGTKEMAHTAASFVSSEQDTTMRIAMLEKALENKSLAVRKHAALQLKRLTGRDYEP